jgi:hypothetical protein
MNPDVVSLKECGVCIVGRHAPANAIAAFKGTGTINASDSCDKNGREPERDV